MKETKFINCEQYVLAKMFSAEKENEELKERLAEYESTIKCLTEQYNTLSNLIRNGTEVKIASNGNDIYISLPTVWEKYDADFDTYVRLLELELPDITTTTKEDC